MSAVWGDRERIRKIGYQSGCWSGVTIVFYADEIWEEWESGKREQFDIHWPEVKAVLGTLENWDIYMVDVSPSNIAFRK